MVIHRPRPFLTCACDPCGCPRSGARTGGRWPAPADSTWCARGGLRPPRRRGAPAPAADRVEGRASRPDRAPMLGGKGGQSPGLMPWKPNGSPDFLARRFPGFFRAQHAAVALARCSSPGPARMRRQSERVLPTHQPSGSFESPFRVPGALGRLGGQPMRDTGHSRTPATMAGRLQPRPGGLRQRPRRAARTGGRRSRPRPGARAGGRWPRPQPGGLRLPPLDVLPALLTGAPGPHLVAVPVGGASGVDVPPVPLAGASGLDRERQRWPGPAASTRCPARVGRWPVADGRWPRVAAAWCRYPRRWG